jgi:hypothetical protein
MGKIASAYVAWFARADRFSVKVRLCSGCIEDFAQHVRELHPYNLAKSQAEWPDECQVCNAPISDNFDPTYVTVYPPGSPETKLVIASCGDCSSTYRPELTMNGQVLPDRAVQGGMGGLKPPIEEPAYTEISWTFVGDRQNVRTDR